MSRKAVTSAKRIVIKIGSSSLTGKAGSALDDSSVEKIVKVVADLKSRGAEVLVVSSGAIAAGLAPLGLTTRPKDLAATSCRIRRPRIVNRQIYRTPSAP